MGFLHDRRLLSKKQARAEEEQEDTYQGEEEEKEEPEEEKLIMPCPSFVFSSDTDDDYTPQANKTFHA